MKVDYILVMALALLVPWNASAADAAYFCVTESATGYAYQGGSWAIGEFDVANEKYVIRKVEKGELNYGDENAPYGVYELGSSTADYWCSVGSGDESVICRKGFGSFMFSPESGRFVRTYIFGYWEGGGNNDDTPHVAIGRCSKI